MQVELRDITYVTIEYVPFPILKEFIAIQQTKMLLIQLSADIGRW